MHKKTNHLRRAILASFLSLAGVSTARAADLDLFVGQKGVLRIAGGTAHIPVMQELARAAMAANPDIQITVAGGGSGAGIKQVGEGLVQIGNSGRAATPQEIATHGLRQYQWAIDGVGAVVHPGNPVKSLSRAQLRAIYAGTLSNWKALGGPDRAINVYTRDEASGTREVFWEKGLDKGVVTPTANVVVSNGAMKTAVANDSYGIGYASVGHIDASIAAIALDGVVPTRETVRDGRYPVSRGLYSLTKGEPQGLTKAFIDYLFSPSGQALAASKGFLPVR